MVTILDHGYVDINDIARFEYSLSRNTMTDYVIDARANRFWKPSIVQWGWYCIEIVNDIAVTNLIQLISGDTRLHVRGYHIKDLSRELASHTHLG